MTHVSGFSYIYLSFIISLENNDKLIAILFLLQTFLKIVTLLFGSLRVLAGVFLFISVTTTNPIFKYLHKYSLSIQEYLWWFITSFFTIMIPLCIYILYNYKTGETVEIIWNRINVWLSVLVIELIGFTYSIWVVYCFSTNYEQVMGLNANVNNKRVAKHNELYEEVTEIQTKVENSENKIEIFNPHLNLETKL